MPDTPKRRPGRPRKAAADALSQRIDLWTEPALADAIRAAGHERVREILRTALV